MGKTYLIALGVALLTVGCDDKPSKPLAPTASALAPADKPAGATTLKVESKGSKVEFLMNAPIEKIKRIITDEGLSTEERDKYGALVEELIVAPYLDDMPPELDERSD